MVRMVKTGGWIVLFHYVNEAEQEAIEGLHQWNFCAEDSKLVIWNKQRHSIVEVHSPLAAEIHAEVLTDLVKDSLKVFIKRK